MELSNNWLFVSECVSLRLCMFAQIDMAGITPLSLCPPAPGDKAERADLQPDI